MHISGNHQFDNTQNSGNLVAAPRTFNPDGSPAQLMMMDLAVFNNVVNKSGGSISMTGDHAIKNLKNEAKGNVMLNDHKDGQKTMIENVSNAGNVSVQGNHALKNITNEEGGKLVGLERKFEDKKKELILLDLATFNNLTNAKGGTMKMTGDHAVKKMTNEKDANLQFGDHKDGQKSVVKEMNNMGNMQVSGNHVFDSFTNTGKVDSQARKFDKDGKPVKEMILMLI